METANIQLQIKRCQLNGVESCKLPIWFVASVDGRIKPPAAVKISFMSTSVFAFWLGSTTNNETIDISNEVFEAMRSKCPDFVDGSFVTSTLVPSLPIATEVHLKPKSIVDWDIVSTQASFVENNLLKKLGIVSRDEILVVSISSSMKAQLQAGKIICRGQQDSEVVRITNETVLIIEPYSITSHSVEQGVPRAQLVKDGDFQQSMKLYELRCIPHSWRLHCQHSHVINIQSNSNEFGGVDLDECLKGLQDDFDNPNSKDHGEYVWSEIVPSDNLDTAYIHPFVVRTSLEIALKSKITWKETNEYMKSKKFSQWMGGLITKKRTNTSKLEEELNKPIHSFHLVQVIVTDQIRPYQISLPLSVQKVLQVADYEAVFLDLLSSNVSTTLPSSISFRPLYWEHFRIPENSNEKSAVEMKESPPKDVQPRDNGKGSAVDIPEIKFIPSTILKSDLIAALIRCIEASPHGSQQSDVLLSHNCIVTLQIPSVEDKRISTNLNYHDSDDSTVNGAVRSTSNIYKAIDFLVEFHHNKSKSIHSSKGQLSFSYLKINIWKQSEDTISRYFDLFQFEMNHPVKVTYPQECSKQWNIDQLKASNPLSSSSIRETHHGEANCPVTEELRSHILYEAYPKCIQQIRDRMDLMFHREKLFGQFYFKIRLNAFHVSYICSNTPYHQYHHPSYSLLQLMATELQDSSVAMMKYQSHVEYISIVRLIQDVIPIKAAGDKVTLTVPQINSLLASLRTIFERAKDRAPSIICLEDLDILCPNPENAKQNATMSSSQSSSQQTPSSSSSAVQSTYTMQNHIRNYYKALFQDERIALVISMHIYRLWKEFGIYQTEYQKPFFTRMYEMFDSSTNKLESDYRDLIEKCVTRQLQSTIYVIASVQSLQELNPILGSRLADHGYWKASTLFLDTWSAQQRYAILLRVLSYLRVTCVASSTSTNAEQDRSGLNRTSTHHNITPEQVTILEHAIEGMNLYELERIGNLVCDQRKQLAWKEQHVKQPLIYAYRKQVANIAEVTTKGTAQSSFTCTVEDILTSIKHYKNQTNAQKINNGQQGQYTKSYTLSDFAGYPHVKESLLEIIQYPMLYSRIYRYCPIKLPKAIMLYGIPGCGKTYLANIIGHTWFPENAFYTIRGPELLNKYIGTSEKAVRDLFQKAVEQPGKSVLIYFDEFEALAPKRGKDNTGITDRIVNQLLTFIDGVESNLFKPRIPKSKPVVRKNSEHEDENDSDEDDEEEEEDEEEEKQVYLLITTSRPDLIDTALLRPGRIEKHIYLGLPNTLQDYMEILISLLYPHVTTTTTSGKDETSSSAPTRLLQCLPIAIQEVLQTIITESSYRSKLQQCTPADCKALIDTAYLYAVHDIIEIVEKNTGTHDPEEDIHEVEPVEANCTTTATKVLIQGSHLLRAFEELRPSMRKEDFLFYSQIYAPFRKDDTSSKEIQHHTGEKLAFH